MKLPFDGVFEVGLTDGAVVQEYGGTRAVLSSHWALVMLEFANKHTACAHKHTHVSTSISVTLRPAKMPENGDEKWATWKPTN